MAITSVVEIWEGREGTFDASGGFRRTHVRRFRVTTNDRADEEVAVCHAAGIPDYVASYQSYDSGSGGWFDGVAFLRRKRASQDPNDPYIWVVTCEYDTEGPQPNFVDANGNPVGTGGQGNPGGSKDSPEFEPWEVSGGFTDRMVPMRAGWHSPTDPAAERDVLVATSAREPFDPLPMVNRPRPWVQITRNELGLNYPQMVAYKMAVNADTYLGLPAGTAQLQPITWSRQYKGKFYYRKTYRIEFLDPDDPEDTFSVRVLDQGFLRLTGTPNEDILPPEPILDEKSQQPVQSPRMLDGNGHLLGDADIRNGNLHWRVFYEYRWLPFATLKLNF